jgi:hypothetical protein
MTMSEILNAVAAPVLALVGTVLVALLGYNQWKKQHDFTRYGGVLAERQEAYKVLWQKLEAAHLYVRAEPSQPFELAPFRDLVRAVNVHLGAVGLLVDRGEKKRVNDYLTALERMGRLLAESADKSAQQQVRMTMYDTAPIPNEIVDKMQGLREAYTSVEQHREILIDHFRSVLGAHLFT